MNLKTKQITYWITTTLVAKRDAISGIFSLLHGPDMMKAFAHLGYPAYFANILGIAKVFKVRFIGSGADHGQGMGLRRIWHHACCQSLRFTLCLGDGAASLEPLIFFALLTVSYLTRSAGRSRFCLGAELNFPVRAGTKWSWEKLAAISLKKSDISTQSESVSQCRNALLITFSPTVAAAAGLLEINEHGNPFARGGVINYGGFIDKKNLPEVLEPAKDCPNSETLNLGDVKKLSGLSIPWRVVSVICARVVDLTAWV